MNDAGNIYIYIYIFVFLPREGFDYVYMSDVMNSYVCEITCQYVTHK